MTVSCIVPAYNEAARIGAVLQVLVHHPLIAEVIVVDDGSSDDTAAVARRHPVTVVALPQNRGKTWALSVGFETARQPLLLLIDADLRGLTADHITRLVQPVLDGHAEVAISLRGNAPGLWRAIGLDYISGERVFPRALMTGRSAALRRLPKFGFEVFLNRLWLERGLSLSVARWPEVGSLAKARKHGLIAGLRADAAMMRDIFRTVAPLDTLRQIIGLRALRRRTAAQLARFSHERGVASPDRPR